MSNRINAHIQRPWGPSLDQDKAGNDDFRRGCRGGYSHLLSLEQPPGAMSRYHLSGLAFLSLYGLHG